MVNNSKADKVCDIIYDFMKKLIACSYFGNYEALQFAMSILCRVKDQNSALAHAVDIIKEFGFDTHDIDDIVSDICKTCEDNVDEILPVCADNIIGKYAFIPRGECLQPRELTDLVQALLSEKKCKAVYNPFAGLASYAIGNNMETYYGQELDLVTYNIAKMRLELNSIDHSHFICGDSIKEWNDHGAECVVSTPPFGVNLSPAQRKLYKVSTADEFLLSGFISGNAKYGFFVVPRGLCFRNNESSFNLRKDICNHNWLEMVIDLPSGIFASTGVSTSIIVLNKHREVDEPVCFVDAEKLFSLKRKGERLLKVEEILHTVSETNSEITYRVSNQEVCSEGCSFDVMRYASQVLSVSEGQRIVSLSEILSLDKGQRCDFHEEMVNNVIEASNFVSNIVYLDDVHNEILVNQPKHKFKGPHLAINLQGKIYVHKGDTAFYMGSALSKSVFKVRESIVDIEYLAYKLLDSGIFEKVIGGAFIPYVNARQLLTYKIVIDIDKEKQRRIVAKTKRGFLEMERKRLGIREAGGDLTHMLGMPKDSIGNLIDLLLLSETLSDNEREWIKAINDNFRYMLRLINTVGVDFSSMSVTSHEVHIAELVREYNRSLKHLKFANCFNLLDEFSLSDSVIVNCDEDMIRVVLDTALRNAYSHGFEQKYSESNVVKLYCKAVEYDGNPYVCITIANNGNPIPRGFSKEDFVTRGKKAGKMGNTGKGGYHIYAIAKKYNGYINISSSKEWSFILDVLIPAYNIDSNEIFEVYGSKCI